MQRTVLITISGMVGTGKSTVAEAVQATLARHGIAAARWRFQRLPCINLRPARRKDREDSDSAAPRSGSAPVPRGVGYRRQTLTPLSVLGHFARVVGFRLYLAWPRRARFAIADRYFFDSFAHFDLAHPPTRLYVGLLTKLVPRPALPFLLIASPETVQARRPTYSAEYVTAVAEAYESLDRSFPYVRKVNSEPGARTLEVIDEAIVELLALDGAARQLRRAASSPQ